VAAPKVKENNIFFAGKAQGVKTPSAEKPLKGFDALRREYLKMPVSKNESGQSPVEHICSVHAAEGF